MGKCKFLFGSDVVDCPRFLDNSQQALLLDALGVSLVEFGDRLQSFVLDYQFSGVSFQKFFDMYYMDLYRAFYAADSALSGFTESKCVRFCGEKFDL